MELKELSIVEFDGDMHKYYINMSFVCNGKMIE